MTRGDRSDADFMTAIRRPDRRSKIQSADPVLSQSTRPHTPHTTPTDSAAPVQALIRTSNNDHAGREICAQPTPLLNTTE